MLYAAAWGAAKVALYAEGVGRNNYKIYPPDYGVVALYAEGVGRNLKGKAGEEWTK